MISYWAQTELFNFGKATAKACKTIFRSSLNSTAVQLVFKLQSPGSIKYISPVTQCRCSAIWKCVCREKNWQSTFNYYIEFIKNNINGVVFQNQFFFNLIQKLKGRYCNKLKHTRTQLLRGQVLRKSTDK